MTAADRTTKRGEAIFSAAYFLLLLRALLLASTLSAYLDVDGVLMRYLWRIAAYLLIITKIVTQDSYSGRRLFVYFLFAVLTAAGLLVNRAFVLIDLCLLILGSHGVPLKKIVRLFFYTASAVCAALFVMSLAGIIENYTTYADDIPRYAFGSVYATDFAAMLFYLQLAHAYLRKRDYTLLTFLFWVAVAAFVMTFCRARLNFILILGFAAAMYLKALFPRLFGSRGVQNFILLLFPVTCIGAILLHALYDPENLILFRLNEQLSGRLQFGQQVFLDRGIHLFGADFEMQGWGFSREGWDEALGYYFVDCGWLSMTLRYGILMTVFVCVSFLLVARSEFREGRTTLPLILLFLCITSIVDHHILEVGFDPFLPVLGLGLAQMARAGQSARLRTPSAQRAR